ncbi:hypothetical protein NXS08_07310 [Gleimia sp. 6138-11-ORH1]|uniref:hypothetical protein n=1 Tax=Gleimia sp. 6138-11-ORH1 TaxID=2973937 RepID=UPI002169C74C|nr:hypothetical protein [Gleimia sp. 6138-11-ORH1]MCS4485270.1 hypothetical protein [Gleimia sp. 6138-11-ORH1]
MNPDNTSPTEKNRDLRCSQPLYNSPTTPPQPKYNQTQQKELNQPQHGQAKPTTKHQPNTLPPKTQQKQTG